MINDIELSLPAQLSVGVAIPWDSGWGWDSDWGWGWGWPWLPMPSCLFFAIRSFCSAFSTNLCTHTHTLSLPPSLSLCEALPLLMALRGQFDKYNNKSSNSCVTFVYTRLALLLLLLFPSIASCSLQVAYTLY